VLSLTNCRFGPDLTCTECKGRHISYCTTVGIGVASAEGDRDRIDTVATTEADGRSFGGGWRGGEVIESIRVRPSEEI
jgi:hypothetical protein